MYTSVVLRLADKSVDALCNLENITAVKEVDCKYINISYEQLYTVYICSIIWDRYRGRVPQLRLVTN